MRFPEFSGEWVETELQDIVPNICSGKDRISNSGEVALYGSTGVIGRTNSASYKENIVLVARVGANAGQMQIGNAPCGVTDNTLVIDAKEWNYYIYYFLQHYNLNRLVFGSGQPLITGGMLKRIKVRYGCKAERNNITRLLCLIDERIATQNKIIEDLKKLKSAIRKKMFSLLKDEYTESFEINQLLDYEQPTAYIVANDEYSTDTSLTPVLTANKGFILGYTDEKFGIYQKGECIIFDDFTMDAKYVSFPFKVKSSAIKILTAKPNVNLRFMFEYLSYWELKSEGHKRHYISEIASLVIELPSKERQSIIASLMTSLNSKLDIEAKTKIRYEEQKRYLLSQMFI